MPSPPTGGKPGRPRGSTDLKTNKMYARLSNDGGILPLEVMVLNMRKAYKKALEIEKRLVEFASAVQLENMEKEAWVYRRQAQECAVSAAPYMHSKLATVELTGPGGGAIQTEKVDRPNLPKDEWLAAHGIGPNAVTDVAPKE